MKFPLSWLREYLDTTASIEELSVALTSLGLEVDGIEDHARQGRFAGLERFHRRFCSKARCPAPPGDEHHMVGLPTDDRRIANGQDRRRIDHDDIIFLAGLFDQVRKLAS